MALGVSQSAKDLMPMAVLGRSGLIVSRLSYGAWVSFSNQVGLEGKTDSSNTESEGAYTLMLEAFRNGVNFFDNAEVYADGKAEIIMGQAIQKGIAAGDWTREDLVISTKLFFGSGKSGPNLKGLSRKHIVEG